MSRRRRAAAEASYVVSQSHASASGRFDTSRSWSFSTLVDCYEFVVAKLMAEFGLTVSSAESLALQVPLDVGGSRLSIDRRQPRPPRWVRSGAQRGI